MKNKKLKVFILFIKKKLKLLWKKNYNLLNNFHLKIFFLPMI